MLQGADRGGDPAPARRRPRRRGDGAHAAQAAARRRRLHARVARGDAAAAARDLPADARARGAARAAPAAPAPRHARLPPDRPRTRWRTAACRPSRSSSDPQPSKPEIMVVADISGSVAQLRPLHAAVRLRDGRASSRRCGRGCSSTASTRSRASSRSPTTSPRRSTASTPKPTSCGSTATPTTATRSRCGTSATYREVTQKTSIILLGDARNNYHASQAWVLGEMRKRGPPRLLARPRAARLLGHRRLDRLRVRAVLRRRLRVPQPAPAPAVRRARRRRR